MRKVYGTILNGGILTFFILYSCLGDLVRLLEYVFLLSAIKIYIYNIMLCDFCNYYVLTIVVYSTTVVSFISVVFVISVVVVTYVVLDKTVFCLIITCHFGIIIDLGIFVACSYFIIVEFSRCVNTLKQQWTVLTWKPSFCEVYKLNSSIKKDSLICYYNIS